MRINFMRKVRGGHTPQKIVSDTMERSGEGGGRNPAGTVGHSSVCEVVRKYMNVKQGCNPPLRLSKVGNGGGLSWWVLVS